MRAVVGALGVAAALSAAPVAGAATQCTYDAAAREAVVTLAAPAGGATTLRVRQGAIVFRDTGTSTFRTCATGVAAASITNTDTITVNGNPDALEHVILDESGGRFAPGATPEPTGSPEIEFALATGVEGDVLELIGTSQRDDIQISGGAVFAQQVLADVGGDGDTDIAMTLAGKVILRGGGGADSLGGGGTLAQPRPFGGALEVFGGGGRDHLGDGSGEDLLSGGSGNDFLIALDGNDDVVQGGPGRDTATIDPFDARSGVEVIHFAT
jgi:hypothetical protein